MKLLNFSIMLPLALVSSIVLAQTKELRTVDTFTRISNDSSVDVFVTQGSPQRVEVSGRKERVADILTEVSGGQLHISMKNQHGNWVWGKNEHYAVYLTVAKIDQIDMNGSGDLTGQGSISGTDLAVNIRGSGDLNTEFNLSGNAALSISGSGDAKVRGSARTLNGDISGSGDAELSLVVAEKSQFEVSGSGDIQVRGKSPKVEAVVSGSGDVDASDFEADNCRVRISGSGEVRVYAKSDLDASTSGSGNVEYFGNPPRVSSHNSGSGSINRAN